MKAHSWLYASQYFRYFSGFRGRDQPYRNDDDFALALRNAAKYKGIPHRALGEKIPPNFFIV
jgi:hypothetical protein